MEIEIDTIDYEAGTVTLYPSGEVVPVTNWLSSEGEHESFHGATALIAGPCAAGGWLTANIDPVFETQLEAVAWAVAQSGSGTIYVHGKDGRICERISRQLQ